MRALLIVAALALLTGTAGAAPTLISFGDSGLKAGDTVLHDKAVTGAAHDAAQELIWFHSGGTLYVIDLRDAARKPVAIATKVPEGAFGVEGVSSADSGTTYAGLYPILKFSKSPKITVGQGAYGGIWDEQDAAAKKAIKKIKLVGKKWLTKQAKRVARAVPAAPRIGELTGKLVKVPEGDECDGSSAECGDNATFGDTPYWLVVTSSSCGDACHLSCVLYDPKTKKFADPSAAKSAWSTTLPADSAGSCFNEAYGLRPGGEYFTGGNRCTVSAAGVACTASEGWAHVGWLE
jgi:hypothetical protein